MAPGVHSGAGGRRADGVYRTLGRFTRAEKVKVTEALTGGRSTIMPGRADQTGSLYGLHPGPV